ncbi:hypothetical protein EZJ19_01115 [Parasulfuritortus cantonensis]|uniref:Uncharacterized protein n=1 Tax=Parasulfuritortus cantonensis TaxID=2528202 RepID=A0A4R1BQA4_9PROT|nr:hypothetical protein [Parasulfuritortus cantonensis]TCJ19761.1 hypothetical protein EZJ19_01115 [Parasulfuritortus cantonensis]
MKSLDRQLEGDFRSRAAAWVVAAFPQECADMQRAGGQQIGPRELVDRMVERARTYRVEEDDDVLAYMVLILSAPRLAKEAPALLEQLKAVLELDDMSGAGRIAMLLDDLREQGGRDPQAARLCAEVDAMRARRQ